jgi:Mlc titration factor MtfA (ptsG expression regulator)
MSVLARIRALITRKAPPLSAEQRALLERELAFLAGMPANDRARFDDHVRLFLARKRFEGVGIAVTDEMRLVIAGCAARLSRNIGFGIYDRIGSIVIYPGAVRVPQTGAGPSGVDSADGLHVDALGVHHSVGTIVLSWPAVQQGLRNGNDGHDTALHELAHAVDAADGGTDGTPPLGATSSREWARVFSRRFLELRASRDKKPVMRDYGKTNEAEFFAVASETFFEKPNAMKRKTPDLYEQLREYYGIDPAAELERLR